MRGREALVVLAVAGCAPAWVKHDLPAGYVQLKRRAGYLRRAVSADGVALGLRVEKNKPEAPAIYWRKVAERYLKEARGYVPMKSPEDAATRAKGWKLFKFSVPEEEPVFYLLALRVRGRKIDVVECAGPAKAVEADAKKLTRYLASLPRE